MRRVKQIIYNPNGDNRNDFISGNAFKKYLPIVQLGIQSVPGVTFRVNGSTDDGVRIGLTGIYELELSDNVYINSLAFDAPSLAMIDSSNTNKIVVDILYEKE